MNNAWDPLGWGVEHLVLASDITGDLRDDSLNIEWVVRANPRWSGEALEILMGPATRLWNIEGSRCS